jgi:hypothetical protein
MVESDSSEGVAMGTTLESKEDIREEGWKRWVLVLNAERIR